MFTVITIYTIVIAVILITRPALMFDAEGRPKPFGVGFSEGYSVFAPSVAIPFLAVFIYILVVWMKLLLRAEII